MKTQGKYRIICRDTDNGKTVRECVINVYAEARRVYDRWTDPKYYTADNHTVHWTKNGEIVRMFLLQKDIPDHLRETSFSDIGKGGKHFKKKYGEKTTRQNLRLPKSVDAYYRAKAKANGTTLTEEIVRVLIEKVPEKINYGIL